MLFVSKNCSLEKVAFMISSCFIICELKWIVFMTIVKHFRVKMRLAFLAQFILETDNPSGRIIRLVV